MSTSEPPASSDLSAKGHVVADVLGRHAPPAADEDGLAATVAAAISAELGQPGARIGRFTALRRLGGGALGVVYAGFDPDLGREVAIKILGRRSDVGKLRLWREALALSGIVHPNVLSVYEVGWLGGTTYIATELAPHGTLADWLATARPLVSVLELFSQVGHGLAAVHSRGLVHRDVKPANLFMGKDGRVLIGDFGLVARAGAHGTASTSVVDTAQPDLTVDGVAVGTPSYAAPEQWAGGPGPVDARADQYAFAVSLARALWGPNITIAQLLEGSSMPPSRSRESVPRELVAVLRRALAADPEDRYPEMLALVAELEAIADRLLARRARWISATLLALFAIGPLAWLLSAMR